MTDAPTAADLRARAKLADAFLFKELASELRACADAIGELDRLREENERLRAERAALAAALKPFALGIYPGIGEMPDDECRWEIPPGRTHGLVSTATVGDSRRAAKVLEDKQ